MATILILRLDPCLFGNVWYNGRVPIAIATILISNHLIINFEQILKDRLKNNRVWIRNFILKVCRCSEQLNL